MDGTKRQNVKIGQLVEIVQKQDQRSGELTEGLVRRILTKSSHHPHGIKVQLDTGEVGRIRNIFPEDD
ncbi:MAG: YwbE family protein [Saprospiraceae bacterium]|nr:YwbE family protein [Saprospiraceae bacterium]